ncbi:helix-turn-helix domain-containing protein [Flavobacterium caeni]|uniref:Helix-turn-helix domain-containing protein n=1 Tax=Flavobacterium caeni TaxID=490189 RepID=A0A1G5EFY5_9FLAO|nr:helix-turn-helix domain-containing protein [Flavobacterium caeni]SCY25368.1 hypothetical protein SAMN02927903_01033 [Flavobacterium caeni]
MSFSSTDFGIVIAGQFYPIEGVSQIVEAFSQIAMNRFEKQLDDLKKKSEIGKRNLTVNEIATLTNRNPATVMRHLRMGLLLGTKVGKSWLISEENYLKYKSNTREQS